MSGSGPGTAEGSGCGEDEARLGWRAGRDGRTSAACWAQSCQGAGSGSRRCWGGRLGRGRGCEACRAGCAEAARAAAVATDGGGDLDSAPSCGAVSTGRGGRGVGAVRRRRGVWRSCRDRGQRPGGRGAGSGGAGADGGDGAAAARKCHRRRGGGGGGRQDAVEARKRDRERGRDWRRARIQPRYVSRDWLVDCKPSTPWEGMRMKRQGRRETGSTSYGAAVRVAGKTSGDASRLSHPRQATRRRPRRGADTGVARPRDAPRRPPQAPPPPPWRRLALSAEGVPKGPLRRISGSVSPCRPREYRKGHSDE